MSSHQGSKRAGTASARVRKNKNGLFFAGKLQHEAQIPLASTFLMQAISMRSLIVARRQGRKPTRFFKPCAYRGHWGTRLLNLITECPISYLDLAGALNLGDKIGSYLPIT
jgi:hypothetical protein